LRADSCRGAWTKSPQFPGRRVRNEADGLVRYRDAENRDAIIKNGFQKRCRLRFPKIAMLKTAAREARNRYAASRCVGITMRRHLNAFSIGMLKALEIPGPPRDHGSSFTV
jgi:hypothetical protein